MAKSRYIAYEQHQPLWDLKACLKEGACRKQSDDYSSIGHTNSPGCRDKERVRTATEGAMSDLRCTTRARHGDICTAAPAPETLDSIVLVVCLVAMSLHMGPKRADYVYSSLGLVTTRRRNQRTNNAGYIGPVAKRCRSSPALARSWLRRAHKPIPNIEECGTWYACRTLPRPPRYRSSPTPRQQRKRVLPRPKGPSESRRHLPRLLACPFALFVLLH